MSQMLTVRRIFTLLAVIMVASVDARYVASIDGGGSGTGCTDVMAVSPPTD